MGYDLTWADDPYEKGRSEIWTKLPQFNVALISEATDEIEACHRYANVCFRAAEALGGYFRAGNALMNSLVAEMDAQRMFEENESMREKLECQNGTITPEEIDRALLRLEWPISPREPQPEVVVGELDQMMARAGLEAGLMVSGGAEAMMTLHPFAWAARWVDWIAFLAEAHEHGGVVVG